MVVVFFTFFAEIGYGHEVYRGIATQSHLARPIQLACAAVMVRARMPLLVPSRSMRRRAHAPAVQSEPSRMCPLQLLLYIIDVSYWEKGASRILRALIVAVRQPAALAPQKQNEICCGTEGVGSLREF